MKQLTVERAKRERELDLLRTSEPKIMAELADLRERMHRMRSEMEVFQDLERMRREHEGTMGKLHELKQSYIKRRDTMRQQVRPTFLLVCSDVLQRGDVYNSCCFDHVRACSIRYFDAALVSRLCLNSAFYCAHQIQGVSVEAESLKKSLAASETAKEIDETEKRLKVGIYLLCTVPGPSLCLGVVHFTFFEDPGSMQR